MKKLLILIALVFSSILLISFFLNLTNKKYLKSDSNVLELREKHTSFLNNSPFKKTLKLSKKDRKSKGLPPNKYYERMWELTMNPATGKPEPYKVLELQQNRNKNNKSFSARNPGDAVSNSWEERGPTNVGGRTRVVLFDPNDVTNKRVFAGGVSGGLWVNEDITTNNSWTQIQDVPSNMNISCITVDPNNPLVWYIGTGEQYTAGAAVGNGVYKTINGGVTWTNIPVQLAGVEDLSSTTSTFLAGIYYINDIIAWDNGTSTEVYIGVGGHIYGDAANPNNWLGLQSSGLYRTIDNGSNWTRIESANMNFTWSGYDFYFIPNDFEISANNTLWMGTITTPGIGGTGGGRVFSSNNGSTWTEAGGSPLTNSNRVELAVSNTNASKLYALTEGTTTAGPHIYATTNAFNSTTELAKPNDADTGIPSNDFTRGQDFYNLVIEVDPIDDDIIYVGGIDLFRTTQGVNTNLANEWKQISKWSNNNNLSGLTCSLVHADQHAFTFRPGNNNQAVIGCDGGVYYSNNLATAETNTTFSVRNSNYNVTQFYYGGYGSNPTNELIIAGAQDNGSQFINAASPGINSSVDVFGGDGAFSEIDKDGDYMIVSYVYNYHYYYDLSGSGTDYSIESGDSEGDFINQAGLDHTLNIMYSNGTNGSVAINRYILGSGSSVKSKITNALLDAPPTAFKVSPHTLTSTTLLVGTENGKLFKLTNANATNTNLINWEEITDSSFVGSIADVEFGEYENDIFVTFHNYGVTSIWYSSNGGVSWINKEGNLPDMPIKCILQNPLAKNEVIVGTELGVWATENFNEETPIWTSSYNGMKDVKIVDLDLRTDDNSVLATTFGRGVFTGQFSNTTNATYTISSPNTVLEVCRSTSNAVFNFDYKPLGGYSNSTNISVSGVPSGASSSLSAVTFNSSETSFTLTLNNIEAVTLGEYIITITGVGGPTVSKDLLLIVKDNVGDITTTLPVDGENQVSTNGANLTWIADDQATSYDVEIATDAGFNTIIETNNAQNNFYTISTILNLSTVYYWKVRAKNDCNTGNYSSTQRFITTALNDCSRPADIKIANEPINDGVTATSTINITDDFTISKVKASVNITHTCIADFDIKLISPDGASIVLFDGSCGDTDGLEVTFDDEATSTIVCDAEPVTGTIIPLNPLSDFIGKQSIGNWTIEIYDNGVGDFGTLNNWSLEFCTAENITNPLLAKAEPITVSANSTYTFLTTDIEVTSSGSTAVEQIYMLTELPIVGDLKLNSTALNLGDTFTQDDINLAKLTFVNSSGVSTSDSFKVDITNATNGFLANQIININIDAIALSVDNQFFEKTGTSVFPTVSTGDFSIVSKTLLGKTFIEIYNINGQKVFYEELNITNSAIQKISTKGLASGIYILKLSAESAQGSKKIIIK